MCGSSRVICDVCYVGADRSRGHTVSTTQLVFIWLMVCVNTGADRSYWLRRDENMIGRDEWAKVLLDDFKREIISTHELISSNNNSPNHTTSFRSASPTVHVLVRSINAWMLFSVHTDGQLHLLDAIFRPRHLTVYFLLFFVFCTIFFIILLR